MNNLSHTSLRRVTREELQLSFYLQCLESDENTPVYAWPWFLDLMAPRWEIMVWEDYRYVMPVACRRKWGIWYAFQPVFAQQLGIFPNPPPEIARTFYSYLASLFPYIHYPARDGAEEAETAGFTVIPLHTRILELGDGYPAIAAHYDDYITQNLKKAHLHQITVHRETNPEIFFTLRKEAPKIPVPESAWKRFRKLMETTIPDGRGILLTARDKHSEIVAAAFFIIWRNRAYYMAVTAGKRGREVRAGFALLDFFFREYGNQPVIFDFEGSSVEGVDRFFAAFGAYRLPYYLFKLNRLHPLLKKIKK